MVRPTSNGDSNQAFSMVNGSPDLDVSNSGSLDYSNTVFSREDAEALLNEKIKAKNKFQYKERCEQMTGYIKKLRLCIKWYIEHEGHRILEKEVIQRMFDSAERKLMDTEMLMKTNEKEYNSSVIELKKKCISAEEKLENEKSDKLAAMDIARTEKEGRVTAEKLCTSLSEELEISQTDQQNSNQKISSLNDMYRRLQEYNASLQLYNAKLQAELAAHNGTLKRVEREKASALETISILKSQHDVLQSHLETSRCLQMEIAKEKETMDAEAGRLKNELVVMQTDHDSHLLLLRSLTDEVEKFRERTGKSSAELDVLTLKSKNLEEKLSSMEDKLQSSVVLRFEAVRAFEEQKRATDVLQQKLDDSESKILDGEKLRKTLHNTVLELKGNIRVFCRVRPLLQDGMTGTESKPVVVSCPTSMEALGQGVELLHNGQKHLFTFDRVFCADASQEDVFVEISQLVQSAIDGYKVCIFAYGQTGSGKTHTMMGTPEIPELRGLIPRSLEQIFVTTHSLKSQGWKYEMQVSMLEIYNEMIRDLLFVRPGPERQYNIAHDADGNTRLPEMTVIDVHNTGDVSLLLERASLSRAVGRTNMNDQSSRSHFVFTLCLSGINESTEEQVQGVLNLVDLAGSERLSRSGSTGERLRETQAINKSLSSLSDVIFALAKKEGHVPFRNSKLTRLLQPCLGGDSKTLMFVNVSPDPPSLRESLCSLRFASRVNACEIRNHRRQSQTRTPQHRLSYG